MAALAFLLVATTARADSGPEHRLALVIASGGPGLTDAQAIKTQLNGGGFVVTLVEAKGLQDMGAAIASFHDSVGPQDLVVIYYAGAAMNQGGVIYLIPTDARLASPSAPEFEAVRLERVLPRHSFATIAFLDTSADSAVLARLGAQSVGAQPAVSPPNTLLLLPDSPTAAPDGAAAAPPPHLFGPAVVKALAIPGLTVDQVAREISKEVRQASDGAQSPARYGDLAQDVVLHPGVVIAPTVQADSAPSRPPPPAQADPAQAAPPAVTSRAGLDAPTLPAAADAAAAGRAPPPRFDPPTLALVPPVDVPDHFCSAEARNDFMDGVYAPAKAAANKNTELLNAYLDSLHLLFSQYTDVETGRYLFPILNEFKRYKAKADSQFDAANELGKVYFRLLAVPINPCATDVAAAAAQVGQPGPADHPVSHPAGAELSLSGGATGPTPAPPSGDGQPTCIATAASECKSSLGQSMVRIVRRTPEKQDPLAKYGAGFFIVVFNKGDEPVEFSPGDIAVLSPKGQAYTILSSEVLEARKQAAADRARDIGMIAGIGMFALSGYAQGVGVSSAIVNNGAQTATMMLEEGATASQQITSERDATIAAYRTNDLKPGLITPLTTQAGRIIVDKINDRTPVVFAVRVGQETHRIVFAGQP